METPSTEFLQKLQEQAQGQKIAQHLGIVLEEVTPGSARASMVCREEMSNILGMVHGTALFALMDEVFQAAVNSHGTAAVALNLSLTFHQAPKFGERLTATGPWHIGRVKRLNFKDGGRGSSVPGPPR
jgi:acyl-CoA thioesterase